MRLRIVATVKLNRLAEGSSHDIVPKNAPRVRPTRHVMSRSLGKFTTPDTLSAYDRDPARVVPPHSRNGLFRCSM